MRTHVIDRWLLQTRVNGLDGSLSVDEVPREAVVGVVKRDGLSTAGSVLEFVDLCGARERLGGELKVRLGVDDEADAAELVLVRLLQAHAEGLGAVAAVVGLLPDRLELGEAKVESELLRGRDVDVLVVRVRDALQADLLEDFVDRHFGRGGFVVTGVQQDGDDGELTSGIYSGPRGDRGVSGEVLGDVWRPSAVKAGVTPPSLVEPEEARTQRGVGSELARVKKKNPEKEKGGPTSH